MKFIKQDGARVYGGMIDRHEQTTGHGVFVTFWSADCHECEYGLRMSAWGQPFIVNAQGGFHISRKYAPAI
jgi:hypothetical protein